MADDLEKELEIAEEPAVELEVPPEEKPAPAPALTAADIAAAVAAAVQPRGMTPEQQEAEWLRLEGESGQTRQQLIFNEERRREANLRDNLPMYERAGAADAKEALGDRADLLPEVQALMAKHPANVRANPQSWKDAAFLTLGKHANDKKPEKKAAGAAEPGKVVGGAGGKLNPGLSEKGGSGAPKGGPKKQYSEFEQRVIDTTCGGDAEVYEKYRSKDSTKPRAVASEGTNRADLALQGLTRGVKL